MAKTCTVCGTILEDNMVFCTECGSPAPVAAPTAAPQTNTYTAQQGTYNAPDAGTYTAPQAGAYQAPVNAAYPNANYQYAQPGQNGNGKKKMPGWAIALIVIGAILVLSVVGCVGCVACIANSETEPYSSSDGIITDYSDGVADNIQDHAGTVGEYYVSIEDAEVVTDENGDPALSVHFKFTNNSDEDASFIWSVSYLAYQDGVELETATPADDAPIDYYLMLESTAPGATDDIYEIYKLNNTTDDVLIECSEVFSLTYDDVVARTFSLN